MGAPAIGRPKRRTGSPVPIPSPLIFPPGEFIQVMLQVWGLHAGVEKPWDETKRGRCCMKPRRVVAVILLCTVFSVALFSLGMAGTQKESPAMQYEGKIKSLRIDKCGEQPGSCEGSIVLAQKAGDEVALAIKPGTWIRRSEKFVLIDELKVGDNVQARAVQLPGATIPQLTDMFLRESAE